MAWRWRERRAEGRALLGVRDRHPVRGHRDAEVARRVREAMLHEEVEGEVEPLPFLRRAGSRPASRSPRSATSLGIGRGPDRPDRARGEARRALLEDEAARCRARPLPLSVRANTTPHCASWAWEMKTLRPFSTHGRRAARRGSGWRRRDRSRRDGSVMAKNVCSPSRMRRARRTSRSAPCCPPR